MHTAMPAFDHITFHAQELTEIVSGMLFRSSDRPISGLCTDSRTVQPDNIFIALRGENMDGHKFIDNAVENGCSCVITEQVLLPAGDVSVIVVKNTLYALGAIAAWYRQQMQTKVVAVTGSVGKTTTKQYVWSVLRQRYQTLKTEGNYNNEIGVPLTLLGLTEKTELSVLEMGMNHKGEMSRLSAIARPDIAMITNIGTSHIENLGSRNGICDAKLEITDGMPLGAPLILNADEELLMAKAHEIKARGVVPVTVSKEDPISDYFISDISVTSSGGAFSLTRAKDGTVYRDIQIAQPGEHNILNAAMAWVVGELCHMTPEEIRRGLLSFENTGMRQNIYELSGYCIIEDCYNASPESMEASLKVLHAVAAERGARAVAVLGDMLELGSFTRSLHERVGKAVTENDVQLLLTFGRLGTHIAQGSLHYGLRPEQVYENADLTEPQATAQTLLSLCRPGDVILFKASRAVRMERVIEAFRDLVCISPTQSV